MIGYLYPIRFQEMAWFEMVWLNPNNTKVGFNFLFNFIMPNVFHIVINPAALEYYQDIKEYVMGLKNFQSCSFVNILDKVLSITIC